MKLNNIKLPLIYIFIASCALAQNTDFKPSIAILSDGSLWATMFALIASLVAAFKIREGNATKDKLLISQKINQSIIIGIETAGRIESVKPEIDKVKSIIQAKATEYGVQPSLHILVQNYTDPAATATAS